MGIFYWFESVFVLILFSTTNAKNEMTKIVADKNVRYHNQFQPFYVVAAFYQALGNGAAISVTMSVTTK